MQGSQIKKPFKKMVPPARLELAAPRLGIWCSIHLSYGGIHSVIGTEFAEHKSIAAFIKKGYQINAKKMPLGRIEDERVKSLHHWCQKQNNYY